MVPGDYLGFFAAASAAAGALVGLLFVAVSIRPEAVFGEHAPANGRAVAGAAFTGLVNGFFICLLALVPGISLGAVTAILGALSLASIGRLFWRLPWRELHLISLTLSVCAYLAQVAVGLILLTRPQDRAQVTTVTYLIIASLAMALARAWSLLQGRHLTPGRGRRRSTW